MIWRRMTPADLPAVHAVADRIHVDHPEDLAVLAERQRLFPEGCLVLAQGNELLGYAISHPWEFGKPPALNTSLGTLPADPTTCYVHDVAILPAGRGSGCATQAVDLLVEIANRMGVDNLSLVAVNTSQGFWEKFGFGRTTVPGLASKLASYGGGATFMMRKIGKPAPGSRVGRANDL